MIHALLDSHDIPAQSRAVVAMGRFKPLWTQATLSNAPVNLLKAYHYVHFGKLLPFSKCRKDELQVTPTQSHRGNIVTRQQP